MKKKLLGFILPLLGFISLSTTGFGLWVFHENVDSKTIGSSLYLEPAFSFEETEISLSVSYDCKANSEAFSETSALIFDQNYRYTGSWSCSITASFTYDILIGTKHEVDPLDASAYQATSVVLPYLEFNEFQIRFNMTENDLIDGGYLTSQVNSTSERITPFFNLSGDEVHDDFSVEGTIRRTVTKTEKFTFLPGTKYNDIDTVSEYTTFRSFLESAKILFSVVVERNPNPDNFLP